MSRFIDRTFTITGLHCASCAARATEVLRTTSGVAEAHIHLISNEVRVSYDPELCTPVLLETRISEAGYQLHTGLSSREDAELIATREYQRMRRAMLVALVHIAPMMILSMGYMHAWWSGAVQAVLSLGVMCYSGRDFYRRAYRQLRSGGAGMDLLVALSTSVAYLYSLVQLVLTGLGVGGVGAGHWYFEVSSMIITFVLVGKVLEMRAGRTAGSAIRALMNLRPETAIQIDEGGDEEVAVSSILPNALLRLRSGERVAVDGVVVSGMGYIDEQMLSGEPLPKCKTEGDKIFAGTINTEGSLVYRATQTGADTLLYRIIKLVNDAQGSRAPIQSLVDRVARVFVPIIVLLALLTLLVWGFSGTTDAWRYGLVSMMSVLIIACPCALGLATPMAIMVGIGRAAREGILIKDAESLEVASTVQAVVIDKTGTLTHGSPAVSRITHLSGDEATTLSVLKALESRSQHPISRAITTYLSDAAAVDLESFTALAGRGLQGVYEGVHYRVGSLRWMQELGLSVAAAEGSVLMRVYLANESAILAYIDIEDSLRPGAEEAVKSLHSRGLSVYLLTGDEERVARSLASRLGIRHYKASVLPEEKEAFVRELQRGGLRVAMVGDGINDSAALAAANLSVAMGEGSDIAMQTAMATLRGSDPRQIVRLIELSSATLRTIRMNLFWAFAYNVLAVPIAAGVLIPLTGYQMNPMLASLAMTLSSLSVVANSLYLSRRKL